jgi:hypothetical protein
MEIAFSANIFTAFPRVFGTGGQEKINLSSSFWNIFGE